MSTPPSAPAFELGLYTFAELAAGPDGRVPDAEERLRDLIEEIEVAEEAGLDVVGIGEHHRPDFAVSAPAVVLAAAAMRTRRIRLSSAVTVLSSDEPVRVFQDFATVDLLSGGRAEIMAGRGSFIESFPLFGQDLRDYDELFAEKLDLLLAIRDETVVEWPGGRHRPPIAGRGVYPRPLQTPLPVWIAIGGTPQSAARAGLLGLPLAVGIIGGRWAQFGPLVDLFRRALREGGHDPDAVPVGINGHGHVAPDPDGAREAFWPGYRAMFDQIGRERGWPPTTLQGFLDQCEPHGALHVGSPDEVAAKIVAQHRLFGHRRYLMHPGTGLPREELLDAIRLLGAEVAPRVRRALAAG